MRRTFKANQRKRRRIWLRLVLALTGLCVLGLIVWYLATKVNLNPKHAVGDISDELDGVAVSFDGGAGQTAGRNLSMP